MNVDYTGNANQRTPCVLVLDASGSMETLGSTGKSRIQELNEGIITLQNALHADDTAISRVQLGIVSVGGPSNDAQILMDMTDVDQFEAFPLYTGGSTPLGKGIQLALSMIEDGKQDLKTSGIGYTRPWMMVITDGEPTDDSQEWQAAVSACRNAEADKKVLIFPIGVDGANLNTLGQISNTPPKAMNGIKFNEFFLWLSSSLSAASRSRPGDSLTLPSTDPWRHVGM